MTQFAWALPSNSMVEWFWLVELLSVLSSVLIGVGVSLGGPARTIPERRVHDVARAIIEQRLSRSVQIRLILNVLVDLDRSLLRELLGRVPCSEDGLRLLFWVNIAGAESRFIWRIFRVIMRMGLRHGLGTVSPGGGVESIVSYWDPLCIESESKTIIRKVITDKFPICTYPVDDIVCSFSSSSPLVKTSLDYSVKVFCRSESAATTGR